MFNGYILGYKYIKSSYNIIPIVCISESMLLSTLKEIKSRPSGILFKNMIEGIETIHQLYRERLRKVIDKLKNMCVGKMLTTANISSGIRISVLYRSFKF